MNKIRNQILLLLGFILVNRHFHTVYLRGLQQIRSNPRRQHRPYSLDDPSWQILGHKSTFRNLP